MPALLSGVDLSMVNLESALTNGTCPQPQDKQYVFSAPASAVSAFKGAGVTLITEANNHGEDCGQAGLQMALSTRAQTGYTILGIGQNAAQAFTPYTTTIHGQHIAIIAATQVIDSDLQTAWTATATQPGLASAYDVNDLVAAVEAARKTGHGDRVPALGDRTRRLPDPLQEPLAKVLVQAGADIIVGTHAHVLLGGGYLGSAYVDYGLGNFAFYDNSPPENASGSLIITATGARSTRSPGGRRSSSTICPSHSPVTPPPPCWGVEPGPRLHERERHARGPRGLRATETAAAPAAAVQTLSADSG